MKISLSASYCKNEIYTTNIKGAFDIQKCQFGLFYTKMQCFQKINSKIESFIK